DLMAMQSSLVANELFSMSTFTDESGSIPSPFEAVAVVSMWTLRMTTLREESGGSVQDGDPGMVGPSTSTVGEGLNSTNAGRSPGLTADVGGAGRFAGSSGRRAT